MHTTFKQETNNRTKFVQSIGRNIQRDQG